MVPIDSLKKQLIDSPASQISKKRTVLRQRRPEQFYGKTWRKARKFPEHPVCIAIKGQLECAPGMNRYCRVDEYSVSNLENGTAWFSSPLAFNDPFDCDLDCKVIGECKDAKAHFTAFEELVVERPLQKYVNEAEDLSYRMIHNFIQRTEDEHKVCETRNALKSIAPSNHAKATEILYRFWDERKALISNRFGILCHSLVNDNLLMWSHYADAHKGFCLEIDTSISPINYWKRFTYDRVEYTDERHVDVINSGYLHAMGRIMTTKAKCWEYEKEYRLITMYGPGLKSTGNRNIQGIILGARIAENPKEYLQRLYDAIVGLCRMKRSGNYDRRLGRITKRFDVSYATKLTNSFGIETNLMPDPLKELPQLLKIKVPKN